MEILPCQPIHDRGIAAMDDQTLADPYYRGEGVKHAFAPALLQLASLLFSSGRFSVEGALQHKQMGT